jgi:hypothetical protein
VKPFLQIKIEWPNGHPRKKALLLMAGIIKKRLSGYQGIRKWLSGHQDIRFKDSLSSDIAVF